MSHNAENDAGCTELTCPHHGAANRAVTDIHSVLCYAHRRPHDHGVACHSTCPTCNGAPYVIPPGSGEAS